MCHLCHQGTCPCAKCEELAHVAVDCIVADMQNWSNVPSTKRSKRDQVHQKEWFKPLKQTKCGVVNVEYLISRMSHANIQRYPSLCGIHPVVEEKMTT